ncbi:two-component system, NtrC family, sensor histidine kinase PilS [Roseateles sp. YR242]|uniref:sensor histidine kinase n=1 Tax=Roseateles sp. YR242 TaxID=1855305 RepID=UPI0008D17A7A|nr:ATP-binding protein [Roseateles sp. YR242]SEK60449.1 two-component system, NtrC family, sensor histidine kinase PilS [Roseateles sp. YR242]
MPLSDSSSRTTGISTVQRLYRAFMGARAALSLALLATQSLASLMGARPSSWAAWLSLLYGVQAVLAWMLPRWFGGGAWPPTPERQTLSWRQIVLSMGVDLVLFSLLQWLDPAGLSYGALLFMPVLMAGALLPRLRALACAALASLQLLAVAAWAVMLGLDSGLRISQAGLLGVGLFVVTLLANELSSRLAREERAARGSLEYARQQADLNRLVIEEMEEGVLVADRRGLVRTANPAARALLAEGATLRPGPFRLDTTPSWAPLLRALKEAYTEHSWPEAGGDVLLDFGGGLQRSLHVRMRFTLRPLDGDDLCVLFVEDNRHLEARNRQEKLAAMGRVSAGIAHEIRNPLTAISQANALLEEDCAGQPRLEQLTRMVASNVERLKRIVDDVMEVAPGIAPVPLVLALSPLVREYCADWAATQRLPEGDASPLRVEIEREHAVVSFDPEHLRRILINLLDNGLRHTRPGAASVRVQVAEQGAEWIRLSVLSDADPLPAEVERHLFEPFFSTRSRGTGLGLYICRELSERYGGRIDYHRLDAQHLNEFRLLLPRIAPSPAQETVHER